MKGVKEFKINNFDLLRLFAATEVIIDHYFQHLKLPISKSSLEILYLFPGVPMFFIISGYLISASYERNNNLGIYLKNRALRIYPGLWGIILVTIIIFSITGINFFNTQVLMWLPCQLAGLIYTPGFLANYGFGSYNGSLWTLPIELQFYVVLPICYFLTPKNRAIYWFCGLFITFLILKVIYETVVLNHFSASGAKLIEYSFIPHFYLFLAGVVLQKLQLYKSPVIYNKAIYWIITYVLFCLTLPNIINPVAYELIKNLFLAFCVLSLAYTLPGTAKKLLRTNDVSYGMYIYHGLFLTVIVQEKVTAYANIFLLILLTYIVAYLSWIFIEKPFMERKERTIREVE